MSASSFDFDVITGPSTPREQRDEVPPSDDVQSQPADSQSAAPRPR